MRPILVIITLSASLVSMGCCLFDCCDDDDGRGRIGDRFRDRDDRSRDDLPPRNRGRDDDDDIFDTREGPYGLRWIGPSKESPIINPSVQNLPIQRDPIPPRAEDPSWRNR